MGDINQRVFAERHLPRIKGAVVEIGSKDYGSTTSLRDKFPGNEYTGLDIEDGKGVDAVVDLEAGIGDLPEGHYELAICCSVLEHMKEPWKAAKNIERLVRPGGLLYISVPWVWRYHPYPDDYYRFSPPALRFLFQGFEFTKAYLSTNVEGEIVEFERGVDNKMRHLLPVKGKDKRKYLPYFNINMIGVRK